MYISSFAESVAIILLESLTELKLVIFEIEINYLNNPWSLGPAAN